MENIIFNNLKKGTQGVHTCGLVFAIVHILKMYYKFIPDDTSTSTGKMRKCLGAKNLFVRIRINAVWLLATLPRKLSLIIAFVSYGAIC